MVLFRFYYLAINRLNSEITPIKDNSCFLYFLNFLSSLFRRNLEVIKAGVMKKRFYVLKELKYCPECGTPIPDGQTQCPNPTCPSNTPPPVH